MANVPFEILKGKTITNINQGDDYIKFMTDDGQKYTMEHHQSCCENVYIEDVNGDWLDIVGSPILLAMESYNSDDPPILDGSESYTWTFYGLSTIKGSVTIRWYGSSNGCYSEEVGLYTD